MSDAATLLIPCAVASSPACQAAWAGLRLPQLTALLRRLGPAPVPGGEPAEWANDEAAAHTLTPPHERVHAALLGLSTDDGRTPWAAWSVRAEGGDPGANAWAWLTPCHWRVGMTDVVMDPPEALGLSADEAAALLQSMQPFFAEDGLQVEAHTPGRWRARGEVFRYIATASVDRVAGSQVDPWMPRQTEAKPLRRLQQEMQMLLYTHPVNEARAARGALPVNSFWVSGTGALPADAKTARVNTPSTALLTVDERLRAPALAGDAAAWSAAWHALDAGPVADLAAAARRGEPVRLVLCGERRARAWSLDGAGWTQRISNLLRRESASRLAQQL